MRPIGSNNPKYRKFVAEYVKDCNATQAAIRAGYSAKTAYVQGSKLLRIPRVKKAVDDALRRVEAKSEITIEYVLKNIREVAERCMQSARVMVFNRQTRCMEQLVDEDGRAVWQFDSMGANKALENLGKYLKLFTEKHEHTGKDGAPIEVRSTIDLSGVTLEVLEVLAKGLR